ncbi:uncharacterized mitochondrial protein AtMg00240-like [Lathyrus oleraceus]|uniref:uncharacterized mitochondrial protein AtMg00240-like n=1 Tax=Pisum sativum TaxID=3888 RepID=UPI0021D02FAA|nr:uncharacterized mitochondrial protein AtMg00240-like [Pisum sativum]
MENNNVVKNLIVSDTKLRKDGGDVTVDETLFKQMVGSLMYLIITRPGMMFGVSLISRFMAKPTMAHWLVVKRILRYLKGTINLGIFYRKQENNLKLEAFTDSDYASDLDDRRMTFGFVFKLGAGAILGPQRNNQLSLSLPHRQNA